MDTNRPASLDPAARNRATRRLSQLTTGVALAGVLAVVAFGALAAASNSGTTAGPATTTTTTTDSPATTSGTTSTLGGAATPVPATGPAHATTGGS